MLIKVSLFSCLLEPIFFCFSSYRKYIQLKCIFANKKNIINDGAKEVCKSVTHLAQNFYYNCAKMCNACTNICHTVWLNCMPFQLNRCSDSNSHFTHICLYRSTLMKVWYFPLVQQIYAYFSVFSVYDNWSLVVA